MADNLEFPVNAPNVWLVDNAGHTWPAHIVYTTDGAGNIIPITGGGGGTITTGPIQIKDGTNQSQFVGYGAGDLNLPVAVQNFPATQVVSGNVGVNNFPARQLVDQGASGATPWNVYVVNQTSGGGSGGTQAVSGTVTAVQGTDPWLTQVQNFPTTQGVSGSVGVNNFPATQAVSGTVNVGNLPLTQGVSGTVTANQGASGSQPWPTNVQNFPATQAVSGSVSVLNLPGTQGVSGTVTANQGAPGGSPWPVTVGNLPTTQGVSGTVNIGNFPATQGVSGTVTAVPPALSAAALSQVAASSGSIQLLGVNPNRKGFMFENAATGGVAYVAYGASAATGAYSMRMAVNSFYERMNGEIYLGVINAVWDPGAVGTGSMQITEFT